MDIKNFTIAIGSLILEWNGSYISFNKVQRHASNRIPVCSAGQSFQELLSNLEKLNSAELIPEEIRTVEKVKQVLEQAKPPNDTNEVIKNLRSLETERTT